MDIFTSLSVIKALRLQSGGAEKQPGVIKIAFPDYN